MSGNSKLVSRISTRALRVKGFMQDFPTVVNVLLGAAVLLYWLLTWRFHHVNVPWLIDGAAKPAEVTSLHLGVAGLAAMVGGFSGVVVMFGLGDSARLRKLRTSGGRRLHANWISVVAVSFSAAFLSVACAALALGGQPEASLWVGLFSVLLLGHGAVRLIWLLGALAQVTRGEDSDRNAADNTVSSADLFSAARAAKRAG